MKNMGIREKIRLGFLALGLLLFFSGLISFFELSKLSRSTQSMLGASLKNMELSKTMLDAVQDQNTALLQIIVSGRSDRESDSLLRAGREKFEAAISDAKISIRDLQGFDSVYAANISYNETVGAYLRDSLRKENVDWFVDIYKTSYSDLTSSIKNFMVSSQNMMDAKARRLEDNAYRATMPGFIALVIAMNNTLLMPLQVFRLTVLASAMTVPLLAALFWKRATALAGVLSMAFGGFGCMIWEGLGSPGGSPPFTSAFP